jgi:hypothetical protein
MEHVVIRKLQHLSGSPARPAVGFAIEARERRGPAHKKGAGPGDVVWIQLHGGLYVAKARIKLCWIGEFSSIREIRARTGGAAVHDDDSFWAGRPRFGYAAIAGLQDEHWIEPFWAGPRTYGYDWVLLDDDVKRASWLEPKAPPRGGDELRAEFTARFGEKKG